MKLNPRLMRHIMVVLEQLLPSDCQPILVLLHPEGQDVVSGLSERDVQEVFAALSAEAPDRLEVVSRHGSH